MLLTDRRWKACAIRKLYADLMLTLPRHGKKLKALENLVACSDAQFKTSSALSVLPERLTLDSYVPRIEEPRNAITSIELAKKHQREDDSLNTLLRLLLAKIPRNSLKSFMYVQLTWPLPWADSNLLIHSWAHEFAMEAETMLTLARHHGESLEHVSLRARKGNWISHCTIGGLRSLQLEFLFTIKTTARMVYRNRDTLRHLGIGLEARIFEAFHHEDLYHEILDDPQQDLSEMFTHTLSDFDKDSESQAPMLKLESLKMIGLDLRLMLCGHSLLEGPSRVRPIIDLQNLASLSIESCSFLGRALPLLARKSRDDSVNNLPNLRSLTIRSEKSHRLRSSSLASFLCALSPLKILRVLFSGRGVLPRLSDILPIHGATLEILVWEDRLGRRGILESDGIPIHEECDIVRRGRDIAKYCRNLVELGIAVEWEYDKDKVATGLEDVWLLDLYTS